MQLRTLARGEREALLDLLGGWQLEDGWRGRDFFRRYVEDDPSFADENVWVAGEGEQLVACVQIFPRPLVVAGVAVPCGGIGSVFTRPEARERGLAESLLACALGAMRERGMLISLLFAARTAWYAKLGWSAWPGERALLVAEGAPAAGERFDAARDLAAVERIHRVYSGARAGSVVRDAALWQASLRNAGNPHEEFVVARRGDDVVAYARRIEMSGVRIVSEWGREPDAAAELAGLLLAQAVPRAVLPHPRGDAALSAALAQADARIHALPDPSAMLRCLHANGLAARLGVPLQGGEAPDVYLRRVLPPEHFCFWPADRF